jgi:hypothetical protein
MAVRVIDPTPDPQVIKRISCNNCGARLEYVPNDVQSYNGTDYSGGPDGRTWIVCPQCNKDVTISSW